MAAMLVDGPLRDSLFSQVTSDITVAVTAARVADVDATIGAGSRVLLSVDLKGAKVQTETSRPPIDIALIVDVSYSMEHVMTDLRETCLQMFAELREDDRISLVKFSNKATVALALQKKSSIVNFADIADAIKPEGGTNIEIGLRTGIGQLSYGRGFFTLGRESHDTRCAYAVILSDGQPTDGFRNTADLLDSAANNIAAAGRAITIHSLGFTQNHAIDLMSTLPQKSSGAPGSYYYLATSLDIAAAVGDCVAASTSHYACQRLTLNLDLGVSLESEQAYGWYGQAAPEATDETPLLSLQPKELKTPGLKVLERQVHVFVLPASAFSGELCLAWEGESGRKELIASLDWGHMLQQEAIRLFDNGPERVGLEEMGVAAHVLRLQVASSLAALAVAPPDLPTAWYENLHAAVLRLLCALHSSFEESTSSQVLFLEGMLQALERDLGEALATRSNDERRGVLLSFAAEHFAMHSTSSLTRLRTTYASRQQIQTRLRFLQSFSQDQGAAKTNCKLEGEGLSDTELACRRELERQVCFAMLSNWRDSVLGLGLYVHPRTSRERRAGIPPEVDLVLDYVSAEAYNLGVRAQVHAGNEETDNAEPQAVLKSSVRRRINAWLPLYINAANWTISSTFAPSAFSLIATQLNTTFCPVDAMKVCARLMCCAVVGFVRSPDEWKRASASEKAVQMYCDVHRLFLQVAEEYPQIRKIALTHVQAFIASPAARTRKSTSDLGLLITYLSILDEIDWQDLRSVFIPEMLRRAFARMSEPFNSGDCKTEQDLIDCFDALEPEHGRVILFFKIFNELVARPLSAWAGQDETFKCLPASAVRKMYDACWGQLPGDRRKAVLEEVRRVCNMSSVSTVLSQLCDDEGLSKTDICELLLWAAKHGNSDKPILDCPSLNAQTHPLCKQWQQKRKLRQELEQKALDMLDQKLPPQDRIPKFLSEVQQMEQCLVNVDVAVSKHRFASREKASTAAAAARSLAEQRKEMTDEAAGAKGKGKGKGKSSFPFLALPRAQNTQIHTETGTMPPKDKTFDLELLLSDNIHGENKSLRIHSVSYQNKEGKAATVRDLKSRLAAETGLCEAQIRLIRRRAEDETAVSCPSTMHDAEPLALWDLCSPGTRVEVKKKQRAGKRLGKPGLGWHKSHKNGRTYAMCIASKIVHELVFSKVQQFFTVADDWNCLDTISALCKVLMKDAAVLCGMDVAFLEQDAEAKGFTKHSVGTLQLLMGRQTAVVVHEVDDESKAVSPEPDSASDGEALATSEETIPARVDVPAEALGAELIFVLDGHFLRETSSLSSVICALKEKRSERDALQIVHIATDARRIMVKSQEELAQVGVAIGEDRRCSASLQLEGQHVVPRGALLVDAELPAAFPAILHFKLRQPALGFVTRLRDRFGCSIPEVPYKALGTLLNVEG